MHIEESVAIDRPIDEVFAYLADPEKHPEWVSSVQQVRKTSSGPPGVGTTFEEEAKLFGRKLEVGWEVTIYEPPRQIEQVTTSGAVNGLVRATLAETEQGTRVDVVQEGEAGGVFKLAGPLLAQTMKKQLETDLGSLKAVLESQEAPTSG